MDCPDCKEKMVKTFIKCHDGSGYYCGWLCGCELSEEGIKEAEEIKNTYSKHRGKNVAETNHT